MLAKLAACVVACKSAPTLNPVALTLLHKLAASAIPSLRCRLWWQTNPILVAGGAWFAAQVYIALWLGYLVLAIYLDNILPNEIGVRRSVPLTHLLSPLKYAAQHAA